MANNNMSLDEMMPSNKKPRSAVSIDLTKGKPKSVPTNDPEEQAAPETEVKASGTAKATPKKAVAVQTGPVDFSQMKPVNVHDILPKKEPEPSALENSLMNDLDMAIGREKESIERRIDAILDKQDEEREEMEEKEAEAQMAKEDEFAINGGADPEAEEDDLGLYDDKNESEAPIKQEEVKKNFRFAPVDEEEIEAETEKKDSEANWGDIEVTHSDWVKEEPEKLGDEIDCKVESSPVEVKIEANNEPEGEKAPVEDPVIGVRREVSITPNIPDDELFKDEDENAVSDEEEDAQIEKMVNDLKSQIKERVQPIKNKLDLSKFTIAKKPISLQKVMKLAVEDHQHVADWVLYSAKRPVSFTGLTGPEILKLNPENSTRNRVNTFREMYRIIFDHIEDANKPTFEAWMKSTHFADLNHIYFGLYMATFGGSNFVNYSCSKCNKVFIKDVEFKDMVEYANDEVKEKVRSLLAGDTTTPSDEYPVDLVQISDNYVFGLTTPSIWSVIIETGSLSDQFLEKHADLIDMVSYIDSIYYIDKENMDLVPVDTKPDPNNQAKTTARRIKAFYDIIRTLDTDEFYNLRAKIQEYDKGSTDIIYKIPGCTCPDCATEIPTNMDVNPDTMLFTRHQLVAIGNM